MAGPTSYLEQLQVIYNNINIMDYIHMYALACWILCGLLVLKSLVLCWRNMTREYSSPYKVGLINVGTKFVQSRLVWSEIAYGKLNFRVTVILVRRFVANANLAPHQSAQVIMEQGMWIFFFVRQFNFRFGPFLAFPAFDSTCDLFPDSASKICRLGIDDVSIASRQISLRTVRGTLVCFIRGVKVYGHMSHSSV